MSNNYKTDTILILLIVFKDLHWNFKTQDKVVTMYHFYLLMIQEAYLIEAACHFQSNVSLKLKHEKLQYNMWIWLWYV